MDGPWTHSTLRQQIIRYQSTQYQWSALGPPLDRYRKAAVLVPLCLRDGHIHVWLTKRSNDVRAEKGDVCFPGRMKDDGDKDEIDTCLREAHEEIGLSPNDVEIVATIVPRLSGRSIVVSPVVGIVNEKFQPKPNEEVDLAFCLPLARFLSNEKHSVHPLENFRGKSWHIHFFTDTVGENQVTTWGLTAHVCCELAVVIHHKETEFDYSPRGKLHPDDPFDTFNNDFPEIAKRGISQRL